MIGILPFLTQWLALSQFGDVFYPNYYQDYLPPKNYWSLLHELEQLPEEEIEQFLPQVCNIMIDRDSLNDSELSEYFESLIERKCAECLTFGTRVCGIMKSIQAAPSEGLFKNILRTNVLVQQKEERMRVFTEKAEFATAHGYNLLPMLNYLRYNYYQDYQFLLDNLSRLGSELKSYPAPRRNLHLRQALSQCNSLLFYRMASKGNSISSLHTSLDEMYALNDELTATKLATMCPKAAQYSLHYPLQHCGDKVLRILRIAEGACEVLSSKERCPYLVVMELLEQDFTCRSELLYSQGGGVAVGYYDDDYETSNIPIRKAATDSNIISKSVKRDKLDWKQLNNKAAAADINTPSAQAANSNRYQRHRYQYRSSRHLLNNVCNNNNNNHNNHVSGSSNNNDIGGNKMHANKNSIRNSDTINKVDFDNCINNMNIECVDSMLNTVEYMNPSTTTDDIITGATSNSTQTNSVNNFSGSVLNSNNNNINSEYVHSTYMTGLRGGSSSSSSSYQDEDYNDDEGSNNNNESNYYDPSTITTSSNSNIYVNNRNNLGTQLQQQQQQQSMNEQKHAPFPSPYYQQLPDRISSSSINEDIAESVPTAFYSEQGNTNTVTNPYNHHHQQQHHFTNQDDDNQQQQQPHNSAHPWNQQQQHQQQQQQYNHYTSSLSESLHNNNNNFDHHHHQHPHYQQQYPQQYQHAYNSQSEQHPHYQPQQQQPYATSKAHQSWNLYNRYEPPVQLYKQHQHPSSSSSSSILPYHLPGLRSQNYLEKQAMLRSQSPFGHLPGWKLKSFIVKTGDDLKKEVLAMQLLNYCKKIFELEGLDIYLHPYQILSTGHHAGLVEYLEGTQSIDSIKKKLRKNIDVGSNSRSNNIYGYGINRRTITTTSTAATTTVGSDYDLKQYFERNFGEPYSVVYGKAIQNFVRSLVGYSLFTYMIQVKDRHNSNILIDSDGHIIHIDYGYILGDSPGFNINFESAPFKLTREYLEVLGGLDSVAFKTFEDLFLRGFLVLQKHIDGITSIIQLFYGDRRKGAAEGIRARLLYPESHADILTLIGDSFDNWRTKQYDRYQQRTNNIQM